MLRRKYTSLTQTLAPPSVSPSTQRRSRISRTTHADRSGCNRLPVGFQCNKNPKLVTARTGDSWLGTRLCCSGFLLFVSSLSPSISHLSELRRSRRHAVSPHAYVREELISPRDTETHREGLSLRTLEKRHAATRLLHSNCAICSDSAGNFTSRYTSNTVPLSISCTSFFFCGTCLKSDLPSVVTVCLPINVCSANLIPHPQVALPNTELNEVKLTHKFFFEEH
jgi:hypothetical protein